MSPDVHHGHGQGNAPMTEDELVVMFHCERVRKLPLSGLDPSILIGFVVRDGRSGRI
jgi:hypothetical protein